MKINALRCRRSIRIAAVLVASHGFNAARVLAQTREQMVAAAPADDLLRANDLEGAVKAFESVLAEDPSNLHAWRRMGLCLRNLKRYDEAIAALNRCADSPAYRLEVLVDRATVYILLDDPDAALTDLEAAFDEGERRPDQFLTRPVFAPLRDHPRFRLLMQRMFNAPPDTVETHASWSPDGQWIVFAAARDGVDNSELYVIRADGSDMRRITRSSANEAMPRWSPDGERIVYCRLGSTSSLEIFTIRPDGGEPTQITGKPEQNLHGGKEFPSWSPDGKTIVFSCKVNGAFEVCTIDVASGEVRQVTQDGADKGWPVMTADGQWILYDVHKDALDYLIDRTSIDGARTETVFDDGTWWCPLFSLDHSILVLSRWDAGLDRNSQIVRANPDGSDPVVLTPDEFDAWFPAISPDHTQIVFSRNAHPWRRTGGSWLCIMNADGTNLRRLTPTERQ